MTGNFMKRGNGHDPCRYRYYFLAAAINHFRTDEELHEVNNGPGAFRGFFNGGITMDACKKIWFYTPAQTAGQIAAIIAMFAGMLALFFFG